MAHFFTNFPITSISTFIVVIALIVFLYFVLSLGTELPSSIILASFKQKKRRTLRELLTLFTDNGLIDQRIEDLTQSKLVELRSGRLTLTGKGTLVWRVMEFYGQVFNRRDTG